MDHIMENDIIVQATMDSRAIYGVKKRAEIIFKMQIIFITADTARKNESMRPKPK